MPRSGDLRPSWTNSRPSRGMTSTRLHRSAIGFTDRGLRELKGLSKRRRVYLVERSS
jgi:hypothetical protein